MRAVVKIIKLAVILAMAASLAIEGIAAEFLSGKELKTLVSGKRVYLSIPGGGEFPLHYQTNGRVDGSGEATGFGKFFRPNDSGRWWVDATKLCQQWKTWYDGKVFCFTIKRTGTNEIAWTRDDGYAGTARIGE